MHIFIYLSYCSHNDFVIILSMQHLLINYINVGVILYDLHETKYVRGSLLPVENFPSSTDRNVLGMSSKKHQMNDKSLPLYEYVLLYKDGSRAKMLPGTTNIFFQFEDTRNSSVNHSILCNYSYVRRTNMIQVSNQSHNNFLFKTMHNILL